MKNLFSKNQAPPGMDLKQQAEYILREYPKSRSNDALFLMLWWEEFRGLAAYLGDAERAQLTHFLNKVGSPETILRRRREIQGIDGGGDGAYQPTKNVLNHRREQAGKGPVR